MAQPDNELGAIGNRASVLVAVFAFNEGLKLDHALARFPTTRDYDVLVVDDGSTDGATTRAEHNGYAVLRSSTNEGIGAAMRRTIHYARSRSYPVLVMYAGNDKDRPEAVPSLVQRLAQGDCKIVQGSRYLADGEHGGMPWYRRFATRLLHPMLFRLATGCHMTDTTNGCRAIDLRLFDDPRINLDQRWLAQYELEPYLLYKAISLGHGVKEVPVRKIYPSKELGYTKMKPITGWWSIVRPIFLLGLGLRS